MIMSKMMRSVIIVFFWSFSRRMLVITFIQLTLPKYTSGHITIYYIVTYEMFYAYSQASHFMYKIDSRQGLFSVPGLVDVVCDLCPSDSRLGRRFGALHDGRER